MRVWISMVIALFCLGLGPCGNSHHPGNDQANSDNPDRTVSTANAPKTVTVAEILKNANQLLNKEVMVTGVFKGWSGGPAGGPPVTRSDWVLQDDTASIYVTGPFPPGCSPTNPGKTVTIKARVKKTAKGQVYLDAN